VEKSGKLIIVINGKAQAGKDTLCDIVIKNYKAKKISSIAPFAKIAKENGWDGVKDNKARKLLSDLKRAFAEFNDLPTTYLVQESEGFAAGDDDILFVHIRESDQISAFLDRVKGLCAATTLLVTREGDTALLGNVSDDNVRDYRYEFEYNNIQELENVESDFLHFFEEMLKIARQ